MIKKLLSKGQFLVFTYILFLLIICFSPFWIWTLKEVDHLNVLIMDKTVPDQTYREHKGLVWILNNEKYVKSDNQSYSVQEDYVGFHPKENEQFDIKELPKKLDQYEVIYLTDQYGVYEEEFYCKNTLGKRSKSLYGGLKLSEVEKLENALLKNKGKTFIAEFNTFASPTEKDARLRISNLLNVNWSGWIGRYFSNLASSEVPIWVKEQYEGDWDFHGAGLVFVNEEDYVFVIEEKDLSFKGKGVLVQFTENGQNYFQENLNSHYNYWFDIVEAIGEEEILANFQLLVTDKMKSKLKELSIPITFPAVTYHKNAQYTSYYFSGDFADEAEVPGIYQTRGISLWKKYVSARNSFYWKTYVPMMKYILEHGLHQETKQDKIELIKKENVSYNSQTGKQYIQIKKNGKWENTLIKGVNMGIAKPGYFPGETAITKDEYKRWFKAIGEMNANAIRVYTLHPPEFYEAFYEYNQMAKTPLYLFHGAWVTEESLLSTKNALSSEVLQEFETEIRYMVDIIHGNAQVPKRKGHAGGQYKVDISPYVLGFIIGIEWDPQVVLNTNLKNIGIDQWNGEYFQTEKANPFEIWLAKMMDFTATYEANQYKWQHTISFTNWVTTDLLEHPSEPSEEEDLATVNPNHIQKSDKFHAGLFASYHIYPYYPDFLNYEPRYLNYEDQNGEVNNYSGYLNELKKVHQMPVVVAEFGVPASRGLTHLNAHGMDQGFHSEQEQGEINKRLFDSIVDEGYAGGIVFSWQDEWFKRTWNTMDLDNPNRRPYWSNVQTNEQRFGLLSFDPVSILVDGLEGDWQKLNVKPVYVSKNENDWIQQIFMYSDPGYIFLKLNMNTPVNWEREDIYFLLDTISNQGQTSIHLENNSIIKTENGIDFLVKLMDESSSRILVDSYYDPFYFQYGQMLKMIEPAAYSNRKNNGIFHPIRLALNKELVVPSTNKKYPFHAYETGKLLFGDGNPEHEEFNSLTDISISKNKKVMELRIPWQLLNVKDPSQKEVFGDMWKSGIQASQIIEDIQIQVLSVKQGVVQEQNISFPYTWNNWDQPMIEERLKKSYFIMKKAYSSNELKGEEN
jgi:hypothetical protein